MIVYQVRITVNATAHDEWLHWMRTVHVPDVIATGLISSFQIWRAKNSEAVEYRYNFYFMDEKSFDKYQKEFATKLKAHPHERFPDQFKATRQIFHQL